MIQLVEGDVLDQSADALVIPVDGTFSPRADQMARILGNIGRQFLRRFPEVELLDEIESQVDFPLALGTVAAVQLSESPFRLAILASSLHHAGALDSSSKRASVRSCFAQGLSLAAAEGAKVLASPVLQGGWRLSPEVAFAEMVHAAGVSQASNIEVRVCCIDSQLAERLRGIGRSLGLSGP
jgi:hypothetical protein